jgi:hypothetical protein
MSGRARQKPSLRAYAQSAAVAAALAVSLVWVHGVLGKTTDSEHIAPGVRLAIYNSLNGKPIVPSGAVVPGSSARGWVTIGNPGDVPAEVTLSMPRVRDWRGSGGGRLSDALRLKLLDVTKRVHHRVWRGYVSELRNVPVGVFDPGERRRYRFRLVFPANTPDPDRYLGGRSRIKYRWTATLAPLPGDDDSDDNSDDIEEILRLLGI